MQILGGFFGQYHKEKVLIPKTWNILNFTTELCGWIKNIIQFRHFQMVVKIYCQDFLFIWKEVTNFWFEAKIEKEFWINEIFPLNLYVCLVLNLWSTQPETNKLNIHTLKICHNFTIISTNRLTRSHNCPPLHKHNTEHITWQNNRFFWPIRIHQVQTKNLLFNPLAAHKYS